MDLDLVRLLNCPCPDSSCGGDDTADLGALKFDSRPVFDADSGL